MGSPFFDHSQCCGDGETALCIKINIFTRAIFSYPNYIYIKNTNWNCDHILDSWLGDKDSEMYINKINAKLIVYLLENNITCLREQFKNLDAELLKAN